MAEPEVSAETSSAEAEAEPETEDTSPTNAELILPPLVCLSLIGGALVFWSLLTRLRSRKGAFHVNCHRDDRTALQDLHDHHDNSCHGNKTHPGKSCKVSPCSGDSIGEFVFELNTRDHPDNMFTGHQHHDARDNPPADSPARFMSIRPLFQRKDVRLIEYLQGQGLTNVRELLAIMMPVILSLGFCPLTLLLHGIIVDCLWPPSMYFSAPNINDAISCFLVPAGMVYAISFGFAFQQVAGKFRETELDAQKQGEQLQKLLTLVTELTATSPDTRVAMVRVVKDVTLACVSRLIGQNEQTELDDEPCKGLNDLLRLLYTREVKDTVIVKDADLWQKTLYQRLETLITQDEILSATFSRTRMHFLQWTFLEALGYFTFLGILLVQCQSYRAELAMCLLTVISISLLCYVVADLDSPFHGFFRVDLRRFCRLVRQLDNAFYTAGDGTSPERPGEARRGPSAWSLLTPR